MTSPSWPAESGDWAVPEEANLAAQAGDASLAESIKSFFSRLF